MAQDAQVLERLGRRLIGDWCSAERGLRIGVERAGDRELVRQHLRACEQMRQRVPRRLAETRVSVARGTWFRREDSLTLSLGRLEPVPPRTAWASPRPRTGEPTASTPRRIPIGGALARWLASPVSKGCGSLAVSNCLGMYHSAHVETGTGGWRQATAVGAGRGSSDQ